MELKNLYPKWIHHVSIDQFISVNHSFLFSSIKLSLLHQTSLIDLFGVDKNRYGIELNWVLWSYEFELTYKLRLLTTSAIDSLSWLWPNANWLERETWEMFGLTFFKHSDLRRLLTDYGFTSYPLLKSYPLSGYFQIFYSEKNKRVTATPVNLVQEFRLFDFETPWNG